jgi:EmrB/QacA subfamily drug resistance transporter
MSDVQSLPGKAEVEWGSLQGRGILLATILGSGLVFLDATSSNVALPAIGDDLGMNISGLQWTINSYTLAITALILLGGSLGDRFGRRRMFAAGVIWFTIASVLCGLAPTGNSLIAARALQGIGGALLTPGTLAILQTSFKQEDRARAIGAWSGLSGVAAAVGPVLGGWFVDLWSWRLIFLSNVAIAVPALLVGLRCIPETVGDTSTRLDYRGAALAIVGLGGTTWALIEAGNQPGSLPVLISGGAGIAALIGFVITERRATDPMMPLGIFRSRQFTAANLVTVAVYGAFGVMLFLLMIQLQEVVGYSPLEAGLAALPITGLLLVLSAPAGQLAQDVGPRLPMTFGPMTIGIGLVLMLRIEADSAYLTGILPAVFLFGLGLTMTVAPLTATVLASVDESNVGVASGVNNAISRGAGLLAIAVVPGLAGITGDSYTDASLFASGFRTAMIIAAGISLAGGVIGALLIQNRLEGDAESCPYDELDRQFHCAVDGAPLQPARKERPSSVPVRVPAYAEDPSE